jgi:hypothetical protein
MPLIRSLPMAGIRARFQIPYSSVRCVIRRAALALKGHHWPHASMSKAATTLAVLGTNHASVLRSDGYEGFCGIVRPLTN